VRAATVAVLAALTACLACAHDPGPGRVAPREPIQGDARYEKPFRWHGHDVEPLATYDIEARVLGAERYRFDRGAEIAPLDLALGWGPMSDGAVLEHFDVDQGWRTFTWTTREFPIPREDVEVHAANVHCIPADTRAWRVLRSVRVGDVVHLEGLLVEVRSPEGFTWRSSTTRADLGMGACELLFVREASVR
jgi:hypothetical protein